MLAVTTAALEVHSHAVSNARKVQLITRTSDFARSIVGCENYDPRVKKCGRCCAHEFGSCEFFAPPQF